MYNSELVICYSFSVLYGRLHFFLPTTLLFDVAAVDVFETLMLLLLVVMVMVMMMMLLMMMRSLPD